jgi:hypothetical protein
MERKRSDSFNAWPHARGIPCRCSCARGVGGGDVRDLTRSTLRPTEAIRLPRASSCFHRCCCHRRQARSGCGRPVWPVPGRRALLICTAKCLQCIVCCVSAVQCLQARTLPRAPRAACSQASAAPCSRLIAGVSAGAQVAAGGLCSLLAGVGGAALTAHRCYFCSCRRGRGRPLRPACRQRTLLIFPAVSAGARVAAGGPCSLLAGVGGAALTAAALRWDDEGAPRDETTRVQLLLEEDVRPSDKDASDQPHPSLPLRYDDGHCAIVCPAWTGDA